MCFTDLGGTTSHCVTARQTRPFLQDSALLAAGERYDIVRQRTGAYGERTISPIPVSHLSLGQGRLRVRSAYLRTPADLLLVRVSCS